MSEPDRPVTPTDLGSALAVLATVTIGTAVERLLVASAYAVGVVFLALFGASWLVLHDPAWDLWPMPAAVTTLLLTAWIHQRLRRRSSTPDSTAGEA